LNRSILKIVSVLITSAACVIACAPVFLILTGAITGKYELMEVLSGIWNEQGRTDFMLVPSFPTLWGFVELFLDKPEFYIVFWNSVKLTAAIVLGQIFFAVPAAWGFSRWHGAVSSLLYDLYVILMLLPFQVTMLSDYMVADYFAILDTHAAIILPAMYATFPVIIIYRSFLGIPEELYEACSLDSGGSWHMFWRIGVPLALPGIKAAALLSAIEYWNMIEQPLLFLKTPSLWPLSIYLPAVDSEHVPYIFVYSLMVLAPMVLLLFCGKDELRNGIGTLALKE